SSGTRNQTSTSKSSTKSSSPRSTPLRLPLVSSSSIRTPRKMSEGRSSLTEQRVINYLNSNPKFLENYVISNAVDNTTFHRWAGKRNLREKRHSSKTLPAQSWTGKDLESRRRVIHDHSHDASRMVYEIGVCMTQVISASSDSFEAIIENEDGSFSLHRTSDGTLKQKKVKRNGRPVPQHTQKLINCEGGTIGQIEFHSTREITSKERQILNIIGTWASSCVHFAQLSSQLQEHGDQSEMFLRQRKLHSFLLDVAKSIFQDIVSMDNVIIKVLNFAQSLVNAERTSLFLVDSKTKELYARIFDVGQGNDEHTKINSDGNKEIRFPMTEGIAGYVARTGEVVNTENAYEDERFNKAIDEKTGFHTTTILSMPIFIRTSVIGVVQMINKKEGIFNKADEDAFEMFAVYCGLALHHAKLYDKIRRSEQKYRVALEVLAYHSVCHRDEVAKLKELDNLDKIVELETYDFNGMKLSELEKPLYAVYMFRTLFNDKFRFDPDDLMRFTLTVRKNYRRVAYHNWAHGWSVAHAMFVLLNSTDIFTPFEALALFISCICHDLDHRGKNNQYMKNMATPLASIYTTSVMEHHHFNQTVTILQQDGHNILKSMSSDEYKKALATIKKCILATDLALFFKNRAVLSGLIAENKFDVNDIDHRERLQAILMTGCDLIASAKPWQIQTETVKVIFEEFYEQGDAERKNGSDPNPMMDRTKHMELPQMQVGFMRGICVPCYDVIAAIIPQVGKLRDQCEYNAKMWEKLAEEQKQRNEDAKANGTEELIVP
ncbi:hypothetical protein PMAYCL1PPCAC_22643, partial [Pristionchus mayeri]